MIFSFVALLLGPPPPAPKPSVILSYWTTPIATFQNAKWQTIPTHFTVPSFPLAFRQVTIGKIGPKILATALDHEFTLDIKGPLSDEGILASGNLVKIPRPVTLLPETSPTAPHIVKAYLQSRHFSAQSLIISSAIRCDLDDDKSPETVIAAQSTTSLGVYPIKKGDFSVLLLQTKFKGRQTTIPIDAHLYPKLGSVHDALPLSINLRSVADFDGDGKFEIIYEVADFRGYTIHLARWANGKLNPILRYTNRV